MCFSMSIKPKFLPNSSSAVLVPSVVFTELGRAPDDDDDFVDVVDLNVDDELDDLDDELVVLLTTDFVLLETVLLERVVTDMIKAV